MEVVGDTWLAALNKSFSSSFSPAVASLDESTRRNSGDTKWGGERRGGDRRRMVGEEGRQREETGAT